MKFLVLALCLGCVLANESILDELDKLLSDSENTPVRSKTSSSDPLQDMINMLSEDSINKRTETELDRLERKLSSGKSLDASATKMSADETAYAMKRLRDDDAPYGYCVDGISKATGPGSQGCRKSACYDEVAWCDGHFAKELKIKDAESRKLALDSKCRASAKVYQKYRTWCPYTCGFCTPRSPKKSCQLRYGRMAKQFGCCAVGGTPALGPNKEGCLPCRDIYPHVCQQFMKKRFGRACNTGAYRVRTFLYKYCPLACQLCIKGEL